MEHPRIGIDPKVMGGKACIRGTRITVEVLLDHLASGESMAEVLEGYPPLTEEDVRAALAYAADHLRTEGLVAVVEASPVDGVWGVGLAADDPRAQRPDQWRGLNLLGFALMAARRALA